MDNAYYPIPDSYRLPICLRDRLHRVAAQRQDNKSNLVRVAIAEYLDRIDFDQQGDIAA